MQGTTEELEQREQAIRQRVKESKTVRFTMADKENKAIAGRVRESYKIDVTDKTKFDFKNPFFSLKAMRESVYSVSSRLRETSPDAAFSAVLRAA